MSDACPAAPARFWQGERANLALVILVSVAVRIGYLLIKPATSVSFDVLTWRVAIEAIRAGQNPYLDGSFNWPPPWPQMLAGLAAIGGRFSIPFDTLFWFILILIECLLIGITFRLLRRSLTSSMARNVLLVAIALNPVAITQVTQHGSLHVLVMVWVMLAIGSLERFYENPLNQSWLAACGWLGMGALTKTVPIALAPLLAAGIGRVSGRNRMIGAVLLLAPLALAVAVVSMVSAPGTWKHLVLYSSVHGYFGINAVTAWMDDVEYPAAGPLVRMHAISFALGMAGTLAWLCVWLWRRGWTRLEQISLVAAMILLSIITLGPGFGTQYAYWLLPTLAVCWARVADARWRRLLSIGALVLGMTYTFDYLFNPGLGDAMHDAFPHSEWVYRMQLKWALPTDQAIIRLPMFCVCVAILVEGIRILIRSWAKA